ncbi:hypothetical protein V6N12_029743 [Hibiscus sabdariffa]|uniref:Uncharacterized protein n=1 Tax=Hibiscus sabdariffa TaxID=183260 RepID=A0ABR2CZP0_9ROSI
MEGGMRRVATCMGEMEEPIAIPICGCGVPAHLRTSLSNDNPGRSMGVVFGDLLVWVLVFGELLYLLAHFGLECLTGLDQHCNFPVKLASISLSYHLEAVELD